MNCWPPVTFRVGAFRSPSRTRVAHLVYERSTGLEYRFIPEGPEVSEIEWKRCLYALKDLEWDWCVGSGSLPRGMPENFYVQLADLVIERGGNLVLDTSGKPLDLALERGGITLFKPSEGEFAKLVGRPLPTVDDMVPAAKELIASGRVKMIAITMGGDGALLGNGRQSSLPEGARSRGEERIRCRRQLRRRHGLRPRLGPHSGRRLPSRRRVRNGLGDESPERSSARRRTSIAFSEEIGAHQHNW